MARVRIVIEYDVPAGTSGQRQKEKALGMAKAYYGRELKYVSYELVKDGDRFLINDPATILDTGD